MALTGWLRNGNCNDMNDDTGSHHICIDMSSTAGGNFCAVTGQPNWCSSTMPCDGDSSRRCPVQHWCVCQWAFASYIERAGGCDRIQDIICDATNMAALSAYRAGAAGSSQVAHALECLESRCLQPKPTPTPAPIPTPVPTPLPTPTPTPTSTVSTPTSRPTPPLHAPTPTPTMTHLPTPLSSSGANHTTEEQTEEPVVEHTKEASTSAGSTAAATPNATVPSEDSLEVEPVKRSVNPMIFVMVGSGAVALGLVYINFRFGACDIKVEEPSQGDSFILKQVSPTHTSLKQEQRWTKLQPDDDAVP